MKDFILPAQSTHPEWVTFDKRFYYILAFSFDNPQTTNRLLFRLVS